MTTTFNFRPTVTSDADTTAGRILINATGPAQAFRRGNILGTVSQSSGVPTGAIIERGSNANGEFVKFADGTLFARRTVPAIATNDTEVQYSYPVAPVAGTAVNGLSLSVNLINTTRRKSIRDYGIGGSTLWSLSVNQSDSYTLATVDVFLFMYGRWF